MERRNWDEIIADYEKSGLTQPEFAENRGLKLSTFTQRLGLKRKSFARVESGEKIERELNGTVSLRVSEADLGAVLKALQS